MQHHARLQELLEACCGDGDIVGAGLEERRGGEAGLVAGDRAGQVAGIGTCDGDGGIGDDGSAGIQNDDVDFTGGSLGGQQDREG